MSNKTFTKEEVHECLMDNICMLENCFEDDSYEEWELINIRRRINELETAKYVCDEYLW